MKEKLKLGKLKAEMGRRDHGPLDHGTTDDTAGGLVVTKAELATVLKVSVRTVNRMMEVGDIKPMGGRGWLVRFYLPDVVEALRRGDRKFGRRAGAEAQTTGPLTTGLPTDFRSGISDFKGREGRKGPKTNE